MAHEAKGLYFPFSSDGQGLPITSLPWTDFKGVEPKRVILKERWKEGL